MSESVSQSASGAATARNISNAPEHSTAYYFLEGLNELGIEHLFCNFGTDHAPTIEAMAERQKRGEKIPNVMLCPHENTAAHMAMGYAAATGRGQAVLVHVCLLYTSDAADERSSVDLG